MAQQRNGRYALPYAAVVVSIGLGYRAQVRDDSQWLCSMSFSLFRHVWQEMRRSYCSRWQQVLLLLRCLTCLDYMVS